MLLISPDGQDRQMQVKSPKVCIGCHTQEFVVQAFPSGKIISTTEIQRDKKDRIKGTIVQRCLNPACANIDHDFALKEQIRNLLHKIAI